jgi:phage terminase Nu1 subunit (DNA packaging protein)
MEMNKDDPPGIAGDVDNMSYKEAVRLEKVSKAKIAELELKEKEGTLVSKSFVFDQLFAFGNELRNALLSIPDREIDKIIVNHNDRTKAHTILYDAISKELEKLSNINLK